MTDAEIIQHGDLFQHLHALWKADEPANDKMAAWIRWKMREPRPVPPLFEGMEELVTPKSLAQADQLRAGERVEE